MFNILISEHQIRDVMEYKSESHTYIKKIIKTIRFQG